MVLFFISFLKTLYVKFAFSDCYWALTSFIKNNYIEFLESNCDFKTLNLIYKIHTALVLLELLSVKKIQKETMNTSLHKVH